MNDLEKIKRRAQVDANREGRAVAILNLNSFSPLYVMREATPDVLASKRLVIVIQPEGNAT